MNTIKVGKILVKKYNKEMGESLTPKEFFCNVLAPLLFFSKIHLVNWTRSKFFYLFNDLKSGKKRLTVDVFNDTVNSFCSEIERDDANVMTSLNVYGGCATPTLKGDGQTTMFCFSDNLYFNIDERYCSFIGSVLGLQCDGWNVYIANEEIIWNIFNGIKEYRHVLESNSNFKDKQIHAWNTAYLHSLYNNRLDTICENFFASNGALDISKKIKFANLMFLLVKIKQDIRHIELFRCGQMNTACTPILIDLPYVNTQYKLFEQLYNTINEDFEYLDFEKHFGGKNLMYKAIECGYVSTSFFNPLSDVKSDKLNEKQILYLKLTMDKTLQDLALHLATTIKKEKKESKLVFNEDNIFKERNVSKIIEVITNMTYGDELEDVVLFLINPSTSKENIANFLVFSKYNFTHILKKK